MPPCAHPDKRPLAFQDFEGKWIPLEGAFYCPWCEFILDGQEANPDGTAVQV